MPQKYVTVDSVATLVHHRGPTTLPGTPPDTSNGRVVLCLHDAAGNGNVFSGLMDRLADAQSPVAFDQPGHGRSGSLDSLASVPAMASHARSLADTIGLGRPVLFGDGMGAAVALHAAAADPSWPAALVLVGTVGVDSGLSDDDIAGLRAITQGRARREFDRSGYAPDTDREVYGAAFREWLKTDPRATLGDLIGWKAWSCETVQCPVLVVIGEHTEPDQRARAEALAEALPNASVVTLRGAGRRGVLEQPGALADLVNEFVGGLS